MISAASAFLGLMIGSFLNALIYRIPRSLNFVSNRSACTQCNKKIAWYDNIPVISYLILRGKCRNCDTKISLRYPFIEILTGIGFYLLTPNVFNEMSLIHYIFHVVVFCTFILIFFIDIDFKIIPNSINLYLGIVFLIYGVFFLNYQSMGLGLLLGGGLPLLITWIFYLLKGKIGLGGGDIKLFAVLGIYLGPYNIIMNIFLSCFVGSILIIVLMLSKKVSRQDMIPFGPFIVISGAFQIFFSDLYTQLIRVIFP